jgi:hypothetical protein
VPCEVLERAVKPPLETAAVSGLEEVLNGEDLFHRGVRRPWGAECIPPFTRCPHHRPVEGVPEKNFGWIRQGGACACSRAI